MRIFLIQAPWSDAATREYKTVAQRYASYPPLGMLYLAATVDQAGHESKVIDLEATPLTIDEISSVITDWKADIIGVTTTTPVFHINQALARALRKRFTLPIVIGGAHITTMQEKAFTEEFDFAVVQEGEDTLVELLNELTSGKQFARIQGLIYRVNGQVKCNALRPFIADLDRLPFPARHKIDPRSYRFEVPNRGIIPVATIELTRGCPFQCVFCAEPRNTGKKLRMRDPRKVVNEILDVKQHFGIDHFMTLDSTLTVNRQLIENFCHELIRRQAGITFEGQTRANLVDRPLLELMKQAGLNRLSFGVESANREVLRLMKKQVDPEDMRQAFKLCRQLGISTLCGTMIGNPGDTRETVMETARFLRSIPEIRYAPMSIAIPYPGTELRVMAEQGRHGLKLLESDFSQYSRWSGGVMQIAGMTPEELIKLQRQALFIIHSTPSKIIGLIQHFGLIPVLQILFRLLRNELTTFFGGTEPVLKQQIGESNTTLKSLR